MQSQHPRYNPSHSASPETSSWIHLPPPSSPSPSSAPSSSDEHIITSGLRIRRRRNPQILSHPPPPHPEISEPEDLTTFITQHLLSSSSSSLTSSSSSASPPSADSSEAEASPYASDDDDARTVFESMSVERCKHDAALRQSLSTLLSCAAAARRPQGQPQGLRVVREGGMKEVETRTGKEEGEEEGHGWEKGVWVLVGAAGAVVVLAVVGFGVGYWVGKEVGKEAGGTVRLGPVRGVRVKGG